LALFIEDNLTLLDLYTMVLEEELDVVAATRGETGYELACSERPDVIVVDVLLPDVDGLTVSERLRGNPMTPLIPIVVLTRDDHPSARAHVALADFVAVLTKPCSADRLLSAVRIATGRFDG
jgi:two-component system alkaline phosphatase synthesis response regulator PhoP